MFQSIKQKFSKKPKKTNTQIVVVRTIDSEQHRVYDITEPKARRKILFALFDHMIKTTFNHGLPPLDYSIEEYRRESPVLSDATENSPQYLELKQRRELHRHELYKILSARKRQDLNTVTKFLYSFEDFMFLEISPEWNFKNPPPLMESEDSCSCDYDDDEEENEFDFD